MLYQLNDKQGESLGLVTVTQTNDYLFDEIHLKVDSAWYAYSVVLEDTVGSYNVDEFVEWFNAQSKIQLEREFITEINV